MFGSKSHSDNLSVQVYTVASNEAYTMAARIWNENMHILYVNNTTHKEFLRFGYGKPPCTVWLQRDQGRSNPFELIIRWEEGGMHEVFVVSDSPAGQVSGDDSRAKALLNSMLTTPSVIASNNK